MGILKVEGKVADSQLTAVDQKLLSDIWSETAPAICHYYVTSTHHSVQSPSGLIAKFTSGSICFQMPWTALISLDDEILTTYDLS